MEKILKKLKKLLRLIFGRTTLGTLFLLIQILAFYMSDISKNTLLGHI